MGWDTETSTSKLPCCNRHDGKSKARRSLQSGNSTGAEHLLDSITCLKSRGCSGYAAAQRYFLSESQHVARENCSHFGMMIQIGNIPGWAELDNEIV